MGNISSTFIRHCWPIQGNICNNLGYPTELTEFLEQILGERACLELLDQLKPFYGENLRVKQLSREERLIHTGWVKV